MRAALVVFIALMTFAARRPAVAQPQTLRLFESVSGAISPQSPYQRWIFSARQGQRLSLRMQATSGDLDPYIELLGPSNELLATGATTTFRNATIENFEAPLDGAYAVRAASRPAERFTTGEYSLALLAGYSYAFAYETFSGESPLRIYRETTASAQFRNGKYRVQAANRLVWIGADRLGVFQDGYVQIEVELEQASSYWEAGLLLRGAFGGGALQGYALLVNSNRQWRFIRSQDGANTSLQEWSALPAGDQTAGAALPARLGLMADGERFAVYYNDRLLGAYNDSALPGAGVAGVVVATAQAPGASATVLFDDLRVTLPVGSGAGPIEPPLNLANWAGDVNSVISELRTARLVPGSGKIGFELDEAFVSNNTAGSIIYVPLARSQQFADMVYSADVTWNANSLDVACGLEFRAVDDRNFTMAYIDRRGGYGFRQEGEAIPALYDLSPAVQTGDFATNRVMVVAIGNGLVMYVNGVRVAYMNGVQHAGGVFVVAYNYAPAASVCQFQNIWVRSFDW